MTTGQRIAAKRKEHALSQEALGETLNVSRQSIYKWESDASLPEIDKLVALSRLFGVSVGWLLGVEEDTPPPEQAAQTPGGELSDAQLYMVEEIVGRYLSAQPKPKKRRLWPRVLCGILLLSVVFHLFNRLEQLDSSYRGLQNSVSYLNTNVNNQISSITNRVETILKAQNSLTADYGTELTAHDLARNTVTFSARVVPRTYVEGMEMVILADSGDGPAEFPATLGPGRAFTAEVTCQLTDHITLSAVFLDGDTRQTQLLDTYEGLYGSSLPSLSLHGLSSAFLHEKIQPDGTFTLSQEYGWIRGTDTGTKFGTVTIDSVRVGLFKNFELICWLEPCEKPESWTVEAEQFFHFPGMSIQLEPGDLLSFAAIYTDQYGRTGVESDIPAFECFGDELTWMSSSDGTPFFDIQNYTY